MKTLTLTALMFFAGAGAKAQSANMESKGLILEVHSVNQEISTGTLLDLETGEFVKFRALRPVWVDEVVNYLKDKEKPPKPKPAPGPVIVDDLNGLIR